MRLAAVCSVFVVCLFAAPARANGGADWDDAPLPVEPVTSEPARARDAGSAMIALNGGLSFDGGNGVIPSLALQLTVQPAWWLGLDLALGEPMYMGPRFYLLPGPVSPYAFARAGVYIWPPWGAVVLDAGAGVELTGESGVAFTVELGPVLFPEGPDVGVHAQVALGYRFR